MRLTVAIVAVALAAGCGPDTGSGRIACELVTKADVNQVIPTVKSTRTRENGDTVRSGCEIWGSSAISLAVSVDRDAGDAELEAHRKRVIGRRASRYAPISGVGDEAYAYQRELADHVMARKGDATVNVSVFADPMGRAHARQLVEIALRRL